MKRLGSRIVFVFVCLIGSSTSGFADTNVSGIINADTTWTKVASPYVMTGDIRVIQGVTLIVEPGVIIKIAKEKTLRIDGALIAKGTFQDKIIFTSNANPKSKGDWGAIWFTDTSLGTSFDNNGNYSAGSILENCIIEYGGYKSSGVVFTNKSIYVKDSRIENNSSLAIYGDRVGPGPMLKKSKITGCILLNNDHGAIFLSWIESIAIYGNLILDNDKNHIWEGSSGGLEIGTGGALVDIHNNILVNNHVGTGSGGIRIGEGSGPVSKNFIGNCSIKRNSIGSSSLTAILSAWAPNYNRNTIVAGATDTQPEIALYGTSNSGKMRSNNVFNRSADYSVSNHETTTMDFKNNWWGTKNEEEIKQKIYDIYDDISLSILEYIPFLITPDTEAPISPPIITKKEVVDGGVKIVWDANPESDLKGYKVHWGSPTGYSFDNYVDVGNVTNYTLVGASMSDTISVTAYDNDYASTADDPATIINENQTNGNESWYSSTYTISGTVSTSSAAAEAIIQTAVSGVVMNGLPGNPSTDESGNYSAIVESGWSGTVTPAKAGYTFSPATKTYTNLDADQTGQNFTAIPFTPSVSGTVKLAGGTALQGATITFSGGGTATTDSNGSYSYKVTYGWTGTATPSKAGYSFSPEKLDYTNVTADQTGQDYTTALVTFSIAGTVTMTASSGEVSVQAGLADVVMNGLPGNPKTDASGNYVATITYGWSGTGTPIKAGYAFTPTSRSYTIVSASKTNENYTAAIYAPTISGAIKTAGGTAIDGAKITISTGGTATADMSGNYSLSVNYGWTGTLTPSKAGYKFTPVSISLTNVVFDQTAQNFTATTVLSIDLSGATAVFIDNNKKLRKISSAGVISSVINIDPNVQHFQFDPGGNLFIVFAEKQEIHTETAPADDSSESASVALDVSYLMIKANPADNSFAGIDKDLLNLEWNADTVSPNLQFDGAGNIYYLARNSDGKLLLRKYVDPANITDLINENINVYHWLVRADGTVIIGGETVSTKMTWLRKISSTGAVSAIASPATVGWVLDFPDGRVYAGLPAIPPYHGVYRLATDLAYLDSAAAKSPYIGYKSQGATPEYDVYEIAAGRDPTYSFGFTSWGGEYLINSQRTTTSRVFGVTGSGIYRTILQYYPTPEILELTLIDRVALIKESMGQLVVPGTKNGVNKLIVYDLTSKSETNIMFEDIEIYHLDILANGNIVFDGLKFATNKFVAGLFERAQGAVGDSLRVAGTNYVYKELAVLAAKPLDFQALATTGQSALSIAITKPSAGAIVTGAVEIQASVTAQKLVEKVEFCIDGILKNTSTAAPYSWTWDTAGYTAGSHEIKAKVYDSSGQSAETLIIVNYQSNPPIIVLNKSRLIFTATASAITSVQKVMVSNGGGGILNWTTSGDQSWLVVSPASSSGGGTVTISANNSGLAAGSYLGTVTVSDPNSTNQSQTVNVTLGVFGGTTSSVPFGEFSTPTDGTTGVTGAIPVTGWVLDDIETTKVEIWRDAFAGETEGIWKIGDAIFVEGARPDVESAYPDYPLNYRAGWGYMMLTNFLPNKGNGPVKLYAYATDKEGNRALLGKKTIVCDNANAVKPFGTIDSPTQGGEASGNSYLNFGWVLTPLTKTVPKDGSTILVYVDGAYVGNLATAPNVYDQYRVDVSTAFPGLNNTGAPGVGGPVGAYFLDTTKHPNGVHTIAWVATDDAGAADGIGSRYFNIMNTGTTANEIKAVGSTIVPDFTEALSKIDSLGRLPVSFDSVSVKKGFDLSAPDEMIEPDRYGVIRTEMREVERLELDLGKGPSLKGYLVVGDELRGLPIGSTPTRARSPGCPGRDFLGLIALSLSMRMSSASGEESPWRSRSGRSSGRNDPRVLGFIFL